MVQASVSSLIHEIGVDANEKDGICVEWSKVPFSESDRPYWAALSSIDGIGPATLPVLIAGFGSARAVLTVPSEDLRAAGLSQSVIDRIRKRSDLIRSDLLEQWFEKILRPSFGITLRFLVPSDLSFPSSLKTVDYGPSQLWIWGNVEVLSHSRIIAIVGTRKITPYGKSVTEMISRGLARRRVAVVSGLMYGVDEVAMRSAMSAGGKTIGVWAGGITPQSLTSRYRLAKDVVDRGGVVVSEFAPTLLPNKGTFPARNRIVSGLSKAVVVTEGASDSGSLITARNAVEQGKPVGAVPGPITSALSAGTNELLKLGATPVTSVSDIFDMIGVSSGAPIDRPAYQPKNQEEKNLLSLLSEQLFDADTLSRQAGVPMEELSRILTELELTGVIRQVGNEWEMV